jgi:hypothetical protein
MAQILNSPVILLDRQMAQLRCGASLSLLMARLVRSRHRYRSHDGKGERLRTRNFDHRRQCDGRRAKAAREHRG